MRATFTLILFKMSRVEMGSQLRDSGEEKDAMDSFKEKLFFLFKNF